MLACLAVGVCAEDLPTDSESEDGRTVVSVDNGDGHEFSIEELPEFQDDDVELIPSEPEVVAEAPAENSNVLIPVVIGAAVVAAGAVTAVVIVRKKREANRASSGETK